MSIRIIKQGLFDTLQDEGRYGFQHLGINPGGAADNIAHALANMLVGNPVGEAVIEMHYPAASISFEGDTMIALSGADFGASVNGHPVSLNTPVIIAGNSLLEFTKITMGYRCYLSVKGGLQISEWMGSCSTNIRAAAGGYKGRRLLTGDVIHLEKEQSFSAFLKGRPFLQLGWKAAFPGLFPKETVIRVCRGNEYECFTDASKELFTNTIFSTTHELDRMGCRLSGIPLQKLDQISLVSSAVTKGTIQLLPNGQLIILAADHQTTGGYPRVAHVISADMYLIAQLQPAKTIRFAWVHVNEAENILMQQHEYLLQLQIACNLRLEEFLTAHDIH